MTLPAIRSSLATLAASLIVAGSVSAQATDDHAILMQALRVGDTVEIMHQEGLRYGNDLALEMLPDADSDSWLANVARIYDTNKMQALVEQGFEESLKDVDLAPILEFYQSDLGQETVALELAARRAFLDAQVEEDAQERYQQLRAEDAPIITKIDELIDDSDLIELNVMGAMNSNLMFFRGLVDGGTFEMGEEDILADVWSQEVQVRTDTEQWIGAFLLMAYEPLTPDQIATYAEFYRSDAGRHLNSAMFNAFNQMYDEISYLLGQAVAQHMLSEQL